MPFHEHTKNKPSIKRFQFTSFEELESWGEGEMLRNFDGDDQARKTTSVSKGKYIKERTTLSMNLGSKSSIFYVNADCKWTHMY